MNPDRYQALAGGVSEAVPSPSHKYRDRVCKNIETTRFHHTILKFPDLGPDVYLTEQVFGRLGLSSKAAAFVERLAAYQGWALRPVGTSNVDNSKKVVKREDSSGFCAPHGRVVDGFALCPTADRANKMATDSGGGGAGGSSRSHDLLVLWNQLDHAVTVVSSKPSLLTLAF